MSNREHLDLLKQGVETWNQWRQKHIDTRPDLLYADLFEANLRSANLIRADLRRANLNYARLIQANLNEADLSSTSLVGADLSGAYLRQANLHDAYLSGANLREADLSRADLSEATLREARLIQANLNEADLSRADLQNANLSNANLRNANLRNANLIFADLSEADLSEADLSEAFLYGADLHNAQLSKSNLSGADLRSTNLRGANLSKADFRDANLRQANLRQANLSNAHLRGTDLRNAQLSSADLSGANLREATLVETDLSGAILSQCLIYGISVWNVQLEGAKQDSLITTRPGEPTIKVDNLEVAQFIYLLLNYKKLRDILNAVTERGVLLLGRFGGGGLDVLQAIATRLREESYLPIIFDFERPQDRDYTETVKILAGLARFVIVDLSGPSVPQELSHTVPFFDIPFVPILEKGRRSYSMFVDLFKYPWVLRPPIEFTTVEELLVRMPAEVIAPAEEKHEARQKLLDEIFKKA